jgi:hypothetical protein
VIYKNRSGSLGPRFYLQKNGDDQRRSADLSDKRVVGAPFLPSKKNGDDQRRSADLSDKSCSAQALQRSLGPTIGCQENGELNSTLNDKSASSRAL